MNRPVKEVVMGDFLIFFKKIIDTIDDDDDMVYNLIEKQMSIPYLK